MSAYTPSAASRMFMVNMRTDTHRRIAAALQQQLPDGVAVEFGADDATDELFPEELSAIDSWAPHRRAQFATGRALARRAFRRVGHDPVPLLFGPDGEPLWPSGVVGSISHKREYCIVVVASSARLRSVGVDLDRAVRSPDEAELVRRVCASEHEQTQARTLSATYVSPGTLFLAAKEAFFKFQFPIARQWLDWDDVEVSFSPPHHFTVAARRVQGFGKAEGTYSGTEGWIVATVLESRTDSSG